MNGTVTIAEAEPYPYTLPMTATLIGASLIGYARCPTYRQDLAVQRRALLDLGVAEDGVYTDHGLTGTTRARPGLDRLARSVPDARAKGKLRGKQPIPSDRQQRELCRMHATGEYSVSDLADLFSVSRPTLYRTLNRRQSP